MDINEYGLYNKDKLVATQIRSPSKLALFFIKNKEALDKYKH